MSLLTIEDLRVDFDTRHGSLRAVDGVSLQVDAGEIHGVVGESGCGKTVTGLSILGLLPETATITAERATLDGSDLLSAGAEDLRRLRGGTAAMIFQDPSTSLNPVFTIETQIAEVITRHLDVSRKEAVQRAAEILQAVGLADHRRVLSAYPHELSGGMKQRVMIAFALVCEPKLVIADEPTTALDVTIQAQILDLLLSVRDRFGVGVILITHDLGVVSQIADRVTVLYAGRVVESGPAGDFANPAHPYTQGLIASIPTTTTRRGTLRPIEGVVPNNIAALQGCVYADRCPHVFDRCRSEAPDLYPVNSGSKAACFLVEPS